MPTSTALGSSFALSIRRHASSSCSKHLARVVLAFELALSALTSTPANTFASDGAWTQLAPTGPQPTPRRDVGAGYDSQRDRLVVLGGSGLTWSLDLGNPAATWAQLPVAPYSSTGFERGTYDPAGDRIVIVNSSMQVFQLSLANPTAWTQLSPIGTSPPARSFFAAAFDTARRRFIVYGGGPYTGLFNDLWALDISGTPTWSKIQPAGTPPLPAWAPLAVYDAGRDQLIVGMGSNDGGYAATNQLYGVSLNGALTWTALAPAGALPDARMFTSAIYDPVLQRIVMFSGYPGHGQDVWALSLNPTPQWTQLAPTGPAPPGRWSANAFYRAGGPEMVLFAGHNGSDFTDTWSLTLGPHGTTGASVTATAPTGTISPATPSLSVPVTLTRTDATPILGYSVRFHLTDLALTGTGTSGITQGGFLAADNPNTSFQVIDNGAGSYTVDNVTLGTPCGSRALTGTLFNVAVGSSALTGPGQVTLDEVTVYDCNNTPTSYAYGPPAAVAIDYTLPVVAVTAPNGGELSPTTITWTASDNVAVANVDLALSTDGGATFPTTIASAIPNTGRYAWTPPATITTHARVRVTAHDINGNVANDASDADFTMGLYLLTVNVSNGTVTKAPDQTAYMHGIGVTLTVTPSPGYHFVDWSGDLSGSDNPASLTMDGHKTVTANIVDNPPVAAITGLAVSPVDAGNDADGTTKIQLSWPALPAGEAVKVYRAGFGGYPQYDGLGGAAPTIPTYPPSAPWTLTGVTASGTTDEPPARDSWYYVAFVTDPYGTVSPVSNLTGGALNYHLGDVADGVTPGAGDNQVNAADISLLGFRYGATGASLAGYEYLDVGPTTDRTVHGRPLTDGKVNIEDLLLFALNYGVVSAPSLAAQPAVAAGRDELTLRVTDDGPSGVIAHLDLRGTGAIQALSAVLGWNSEVVAPTAFAPGELLVDQHGVAMSPSPGSVDAALLGLRAQGMSGAGEVATIRFRRLKSGDDGIVFQSTMARSALNQDVPLATKWLVTGIPTTTMLAAVLPNPFKSTATLSFSLSRSGPADLEIFSVDGRRVRTLAHGDREAGEYSIAWDGLNELGQPVHAGIYYAQLSTVLGRMHRTVVRLR